MPLIARQTASGHLIQVAALGKLITVFKPSKSLDFKILSVLEIVTFGRKEFRLH